MTELSVEALVEAGLAALRQRLPSRWTVELSRGWSDETSPDVVIRSEPSGGQASMIIEARADLAPRDIKAMVGNPLFRRIRDRSAQTYILVIAPHLSSRARDILTSERINFVDLGGNMRLELEHPGLFIESSASGDEPSREPARGRGLRGAKVGAVVRTLVDAIPPYSAADLALVSGVNEGYVSRILEPLVDEALVERAPRGPIANVDWPELLRRRAQAVRLFRPPGPYLYVARRGPRQTLSDLRAIREASTPRYPPLITGSYAAQRMVVVAPATQLVVYSMERVELAERLELIEVDSGADVILIRPDNEGVYERAVEDMGIYYAAPSQVAIDCLSGPGRMPAEGDAVVEWMNEHIAEWRRPIAELSTSRERPA